MGRRYVWKKLAVCIMLFAVSAVLLLAVTAFGRHYVQWPQAELVPKGDAVPEPGTMLLFGSGILAMGFLWKSRK